MKSKSSKYTQAKSWQEFVTLAFNKKDAIYRGYIATTSQLLDIGVFIKRYSECNTNHIIYIGHGYITIHRPKSVRYPPGLLRFVRAQCDRIFPEHVDHITYERKSLTHNEMCAKLYQQ